MTAGGYRHLILSLNLLAWGIECLLINISTQSDFLMPWGLLLLGCGYGFLLTSTQVKK